MRSWKHLCSVAAAAIAVTLAPLVARAADKPIDVIFALPAPTLTFSAPFLAEDAGLYKKEGLNVSHRMLVGVEAVNAVIAGSADFTDSTGPVFLRANAKGQPLHRDRQSDRQAAGRDGDAHGCLSMRSTSPTA